jgi:hypothetical protein
MCRQKRAHASADVCGFFDRIGTIPRAVRQFLFCTLRNELSDEQSSSAPECLMPATKRKPATAPDQAALRGLLISAGAGQARFFCRVGARQ